MKSIPFKITSLQTIEELDSIQQKIDNGEYNPLEFFDILASSGGFEDPMDRVVEIDELTSIMIVDINLAKNIFTLLKKFGTKVRIEDASEDFFTGKLSLDLLTGDLREQVKRHIISEYGVNDVLDKISVETIKCLTEMDETILKTKKAT